MPGGERAREARSPLREAAADRIAAAMRSVVAEHGYAAATVSRVVDRAGVSRATFYECFRSREECFADVYAAAVRECRARIGAAGDVEAGARPRAVVDALLESATTEPAATRLMLIDALGGPPGLRDEHERRAMALGKSIEAFLAAQADAQVLHAPPLSLLGGVAGAVAMHLLRGEGPRLRSLAPELHAWVDSYRLDAEDRESAPSWGSLRELVEVEPAPAGSADARLLPRGRQALPDASASTLRRLRVIQATAALMAAKGFRRTTVSDIVAAARIPRGAFYAQFAGKAEAFAAAQTHGMQEAVARSAAEYSVPGTWPERVWSAVDQLLSYVAAQPALATLDFVESFVAGPEAVLKRAQNQMAFAIFLEDGYRQVGDGPGPPRLFSEAIAMAVYAMMRAEVVVGRTAEMRTLLPECTYVILAPFIGARRALHFAVARARGVR